MRIDVATGEIIFSTGTLAPDQSCQKFLELPVGQSSTKGVMGGNWILRQCEPEPGIFCSAYFDADRLRYVSISFAMPSDDTEAGTEKQERARNELHSDWLEANVGKPPYEYFWGTLDSSRDVKTGDAGISINYETTRSGASQA